MANPVQLTAEVWVGDYRTLAVGATNTVKLRHLKDVIADAWVNDATVSVDVYDCAETNAEEALIDTATLAKVDGYDGEYAVNLPDTLEIEKNKFYELVITASSGDCVLKESVILAAE